MPALLLSVRVFGQMAVRVVAPLAFIREPAVGPDLRRAQNLSARAQNAPEGFVVENRGEGECCHAQFPVVSRKAAVQASRHERVLTTWRLTTGYGAGSLHCRLT